MPESGLSSRLPAKHRLALTLSLAFFIHTLLASLFPLLVPQSDDDTPTIRFQLVAPGSTPSEQRRAGQAQRPREEAETRDRVSAFEVEPLTPQETRQPRNERREAPSRESAEAPERDHSRSETAAGKAGGADNGSTQGSASTPTEGSQAGQQTPVPTEVPTTDTVSSVDIPEKETDPYLLSLIEKLASQLDQHPVPALRELDNPVYVTVELQLMSNGTLVKADLARRSGVDSLDRAAYRAALGASPYPEPPHSSGRKRYRVNLVFSPQRL